MATTVSNHRFKNHGLSLKIPPRSIVTFSDEEYRIKNLILNSANTADIVYTNSSGNSLYVGGLNYLSMMKNSVEFAGIISLEKLPSSVKISQNHLQIDIIDSAFQDIQQYFAETNKFIKDNLVNGHVFVHCMAGISRSVTIVAAFLMEILQISADEAVTYIKMRREQAMPNSGFMKQLRFLTKF
jgi:protein tyrosine phosphatase